MIVYVYTTHTYITLCLCNIVETFRKHDKKLNVHECGILGNFANHVHVGHTSGITCTTLKFSREISVFMFEPKYYGDIYNFHD